MDIKEATFKNEDPRLPKVLVYKISNESNKVCVYFNAYRIIGNSISLRLKNVEVGLIENCKDKQIKEFIQTFNRITKR